MSEKIKIDGCTLGEYIKTIRTVKNLSTQKLAEIAGLSAGYVNKIELDKTTNYDINKLKQLAVALNIDMNKILQYIGYQEVVQEVNDENTLIEFLKRMNLSDGSIIEILNYIAYVQFKQKYDIFKENKKNSIYSQLIPDYILGHYMQDKNFNF